MVQVQVIRLAFYVGYAATPPKVYRVPTFPMLQEDNTREGVLKDEDYDYDKLAEEVSRRRFSENLAQNVLQCWPRQDGVSSL